jgi:hypothetical protein
LDRISTRQLARLVSVSSGEDLAFFHSGASVSAAHSVFASGPKLVPADPALQSCEYLLEDRPAAQPYITAAIDAAAARGLAKSATSLRSKVNVVLIGDNPLQQGALVVVLLVSGSPSKSGPNGQIIFGPDSSIFVVLDRDTKAISGVAAGTW